MKFTDHNSPEKAIINNNFKTIPYMDMCISSIVEGYIYGKVDKITKYGGREKYTTRYRKKEGEYKHWLKNGQITTHCYYKEGKLNGECKWWWDNGQLCREKYYKDGKKEGEYQEWDIKGNFIEHRIYKDGEIIEDLLYFN